jgi:hypothetical protein
MFNRWSLWEFILRRVAKAQGFLDPRVLFSQIQRFSRPSEVWVPSELLRSGMVLQGRGLLNSQAIQNNLDWVWPYWVNQQFYPKESSFIPRAFSLTHINLTHRNWTALGVPDFSDYALVDPRGLVTPLFDGWSIDAWIIKDDSSNLIPAQLPDVYQQMRLEKNLQVITFSNREGMSLQSCAEVNVDSGTPTCRISYYGHSELKAWLMICIRPYNPEGISLIDSIERLPMLDGWSVNKTSKVYLKQTPSRYIFSNYQLGDLLSQISSLEKVGGVFEEKEVHCPVGMAMAAAVYELPPHQSKEVIVEIPLIKTPLETSASTSWNDHLQNSCQIEVPDKHFQSLFDVALRTLVLHSPDDVYPGPYTYKRFWFRDAAFIIYAMLAAGLTKNIEKIINSFPKRQTALGYFQSQDGEWDSNGQAIWAIERFSALTGQSVSSELLSSVKQGAHWIKRKRLPSKKQCGHSGLLPAGFSAEHFGPTDFYYWDDFWAVAGLEAASSLLENKDSELASVIKEEASDFRKAIETSLQSVEEHLEQDGIPASPYRRMDAGAIGSLIASYPLQLYAPEDKRMLSTVDFLIRKYLLGGAYYHELSHSGINIYLTLQLAQVLLRAGDHRFFDMVRRVADLATPTGQWPEAIHPQTKGGCMGDGQHVWAAAEWVLMIRNMFVREEEQQKTLVLCSGIPRVWLKKKQRLFLGPTNTVFGPISVTIEVGDDIHVWWKAQWRGAVPRIEIRLPGYANYLVENQEINNVELKQNGKVYAA